MLLRQSLEASQKKPITVGPWGGQHGLCWDDGVYSSVRQLVIAHGVGIDSIQIEYDNRGTSIWSEKHGGNGSNRIDRVSHTRNVYIALSSIAVAFCCVHSIIHLEMFT